MIDQPRPAFKQRTVHGKRVAFSREDEGGDPRAILLGQCYSLCGFPGQGFDEYWVRRIRNDFDRTFVPIMRRMVFRDATGGEIRMENWGVSRYSTKQPAPEWELKLLHGATRATRGYFSTLERPNIIDCWAPLGQGMDADGLPPLYEPFNGAFMYAWFQSIYRDRQACKTTDAFELLLRLQRERAEQDERDMDHEIDDRARGAVDMFPKISTTNVRPTPRTAHIQETASCPV